LDDNFKTKTKEKLLKKQILFLTTILLSVVLFAETKIGYVDWIRIMDEYQPAREATRLLEQEYQKLEQEYYQMGAKLDSLLQQYEMQKLMYSEEFRAQKESEIQSLQIAIQEFQAKKLGPDGEIYKTQRELEEPIMKEITAAIEKVAKDMNFDFVLKEPGGSLVYADPKWDVTDDVLYELRHSGE